MPKLQKYEDGIPKYKKVSKKKTGKKSNHKHTYAKGILLYEGKKNLCDYCTICGKVNKVYWHLDFIKRGADYEKNKELLNSSDIPVFEVNESVFYVDYVPISSKNSE